LSERYTGWFWGLAAIVAAVTVWVLLSFNGSSLEEDTIVTVIDSVPRTPVAQVGEYILYDTDLAFIRAGEGAVESWTRDQLLACAAEEAGIENPSISRFAAERARQVYLRDLMLSTIIESVPVPDEQEIIIFMYSDPELYLVERHYYQIIASDSSMADSLHTRLGWGQNFQVMAQNISIGQKAGIGGDLGFFTGAEMLVNGLPEEVARLDGLSPVIPSTMGWHIFKVSETREMEDSVRAVESAGQVLYNDRIQSAVDSVLQVTENRFSTEV